MKKKSKKKNYKKKFILRFSILLVIVLICGLIYYFYSKNKYTFKLTDKNITVKLNEDVNPKTYIQKIKKATVKYNSIRTDKVGTYKITYTVTDKLFNHKHKYNLKVYVVDDISPIIESKGEITIYKGDKLNNLLSYVKVTDNYDEDIKTTTNGSVDTSKVGEYKVTYTAVDKSNNKTKKTVKFIVKEKSITTPTTLVDGVVGTSSKGYKIENKGGATYVGGYLVANKTYPLSSNYGSGLTGSTKSAFEEMKAAAILDGFDLYIGSGYRSYNTQKTIYNNYVKRDGQAKADTYSARAGHSEHQSGLAIDICDRTVKACINSNYNDTASAKWLSDNAYKYGFILRYPNGKTGETGYKFESWHYRYVGKELASTLYNGGSWITMEDYFGITSKYE